MDQVSYEISIKRSRDYNSTGVVVGYKTDVKDGETREQAMARCIDFVEDIVDEKHKELEEIHG